MICPRKRRGKEVDGRFAKPVWTKSSPSWQEIDARLPSEHLARRIDWLVDRLDVRMLFASHDGRGSRAHRPDLLLKMVLYEIECGKPSPAEWWRDARENDTLKWLMFGIQPCRAAGYEFRDRVASYWDSWNEQVLQMAQQEGCKLGGRGALDGTLVAALASRHKLVNQKTLEARMVELRKTIAAEQKQEGVGQLPSWMAKHPTTRIPQEQRYQAAWAQMQQLLAENRKRAASDRKKPEKIVVSVSDPETAVGRDKLKVFRPLYNVQLVYDLDSPFITAYEVFPWQNDAGTVEPMLERCAELTGRKPEAWLADSAYAGGPDLAVCDHHAVTLYAPVGENDFSNRKRRSKKPPQIPKKEFAWLPEEKTYRCPEGHLLRPRTTTSVWHFGDRTTLQTTFRCPPKFCQECSRKSACTSNPQGGRTISRLEHEDLIEQLRQRMETPEAKALYKLRRQTVELRYADLKEHRSLRRFTGHGLRRARAQIAALVLAHNLLALSRIPEPEKPTPAYAGVPEKIPP